MEPVDQDEFIRELEMGADYELALRRRVAPMRNMLTSLLKRQPFEPFRIHMTSGSDLEVWAAEQATLGDTVATIRQRNAESGAWETRSILALLHIVSIESLGVDRPPIVARNAELAWYRSFKFAGTASLAVYSFSARVAPCVR